MYINSERDALCYLTDRSTNGTLVQIESANEAAAVRKDCAFLLGHGDRIEIPEVCRYVFQQRLTFAIQESEYLEDLSKSLSIYARGWVLSRRVLGTGGNAFVLMASNETAQTACKVQPRKRDVQKRLQCSCEIEILRQVSHVCQYTL